MSMLLASRFCISLNSLLVYTSSFSPLPPPLCNYSFPLSFARTRTSQMDTKKYRLTPQLPLIDEVDFSDGIFIQVQVLLVDKVVNPSGPPCTNACGISNPSTDTLRCKYLTFWHALHCELGALLPQYAQNSSPPLWIASSLSLTRLESAVASFACCIRPGEGTIRPERINSFGCHGLGSTFITSNSFSMTKISPPRPLRPISGDIRSTATRPS